MLRTAARRAWAYSRHCPCALSSRQPSLRWLRRSRFSTTATTSILPVFKQAEKFKDDIALTDQHGEHTYGHIHRLSGHLAWQIQTVLGKDAVQQRIVFLCPNDVSYVISQWATWMAGHIAVPLYPRHPPPELEYFIRDSEAAVIITTSEYAPKVKQIIAGQQVIVLEEFFFKPSLEDDALRPAHFGQDPQFYAFSDAMILYTSGTTGPPKGVLLSHSNVQSQVGCLHQAWGWTQRDTLLHCLPLHHTHGIINALLCPLYIGARVVMLPSFSPAEVWSHLLALNAPVEARVSLFMAVPTMYVKLLDEYHARLAKTSRTKEYVRSVCTQNMRLMISGSAALPESVLASWQEVTGHVLLERYGMTEIGMALSNPLKGTRHPGFVGTPLPGVEVRIAKFVPRQKDYQVVCEGSSAGTKVMPGCENESGELLVRGPSVFKEYWRNPDATSKEFTHDGWFRTGDTAQCHEGSYKILGRTSIDIIKSGGFKISALDVERELLTHPDIADVAVVGVPDLTWGQKVAAVVVWHGEGELDPVALREWGRERMPHYKVPSEVVQVKDTLPRNNMGKVNKKQLLLDFFKDPHSLS
ncbi:Acyl-CoA synthetase family member 3, mitochondrial [Chionoecetes opilio]|uniref:Acyl-CoA synthetase family member 3, mitochondrial n=1 Tax=Chionoecetes opilio TaxID=41210 RepID=A0A8J4YJK8_CHIOP|nr:Acyl-CoA synthetase family member 3, mitochondrial [Chionoecetes opilio]